MMDERKDKEYLERFLRRELTEEEVEDLSQRLEKDDELALAYAEAIAVQESLRNRAKQAIREQTGTLKTGQKIPFSYFVGIVLLALVLLAAFLVYLRHSGQNVKINIAEGEEVIAKILDREKENLPIAGPVSWQYLLAQRRYEEALIVLDSLIASIESPCENHEFRYYAGLLKLYIGGRLRNARELLECTLGPSAEQSFRPDVPQHIATLYALEGEQEAARDIIEKYGVPRDSLLSQVAAYLYGS